MNFNFAIITITLLVQSFNIWAQDAKNQKESLEEMPARVYNKVSPATVNINCNNGLVKGSGSVVGLLSRGNAVILTACHVVASNYADAMTDPDIRMEFYKDIKVKVGDQAKFIQAVVIPDRFDGTNDIALLVSLAPVPQAAVIRYNRSSGVKPGRKVAAFGFPDSDQLSQTVGLVKRLEEKFIVFDAKVAPGSSGGPLVDKSGRMIGMSISTLNDEGFALPMDLVLSIADGWVKNMNLKEIWQRQKYTSFGQRMFKDPLFVISEIAVLGGAGFFALRPPSSAVPTFGAPPGPPGE
jgi:S1-C subfamily serine protease